jgi:hypothetical protein
MEQEPNERAAMSPQMDQSATGQRSSALFFLLLGAVVSLGSMYWVGHRNPSLLLMALFTVWVGSPFAGMTLILKRSLRWPIARQNVTCKQIRFISIASVIAYVSVGLKHFAKPAAPFLALPLATWLLMAVWFWMTPHTNAEGSGETNEPTGAGRSS